MDFDMKQIKGIFQVTNEADKNKLSGEVTTLLLSLSDARFNEHLLVESSDQAILYYYAGYISRSLLKSMPNTCSACKDLLTSGFAENEIEIKDADCYDNTSARDEFISIVTRGGLSKPSGIVYIYTYITLTLNIYIYIYITLTLYILPVCMPGLCIAIYAMLMFAKIY